jgi:hypothetical protein
MTTEWYRFFWNIYGFTGTGVVPVSKGGTGLNTIGDHQLIIGNANNVFEPASLSSASIAITYPAGFINLELGTSGVTPGTYGSASTVGVFTVNAYGVLTAASNTSIGIDANQIISGTLLATRGGTGQSIYAIGDMLYATGTTALSKLTIGASTYLLTSSGTAPQWTIPSSVTVGTATNLAGGLANQIPYQTGAGATTFMVAPTIAGTYLNWSGSAFQWSSNPLGDVVGPASATDNAIARFDNTTGKLIQNSVVTIGDTGATTGITTLSASTSVTTPIVQASNSAGLALKNASGTTQISMGAGGGDNLTIAVATNINGANAQIDISPTGTGHVHIKPSGTGSIEMNPTSVGTIDNMTIGATTPKAITGTTVTATSFVGSGASLTNVVNSAAAGTGISVSGATGAVTITNTAPDQTVSLTAGTGISTSGTYPNFTITNTAPSSGGTVTSVAALTLGTTGTDLSSTVANGTTTPVITLQVPTASATNRGALSAADWTTFNSKANAFTYTTGYIPFGQGTTTPNQSAGLQFDGTNFTTTGYATATSFRPSASTVPTNGMYLPAANSVALATNSTGSLWIDSTQKVGIGTSAPNQKLHVYGNTGTTIASVGDNALTAPYIHINADATNSLGRLNVRSNHGLTLGTNNTVAMTINTSQQVGIGVSPSYILDVLGSVRLKTNVTATPVIVSTGGNSQGNLRFGSTGTEYSIYGGADYLSMQFFANGAERMRLPSAGGVQAVTTISVGNATPSASGAGITFPATQSASTDANTLDDYEEGTWTPSFSGLTVTGSPTYSGTYTKIGRAVYVNWVILTGGTATTSSTANSTSFSGLPFTIASSGVMSVSSNNISNIGVGMLYSGTTAYTPTWIATTDIIYGSGFYTV